MKLLFTVALVLIMAGCADKPEISLEQLSGMIERGQKDKALVEIKKQLTDQNLRNSTLLSGVRNPRRIMKRSLAGNSIAWLEDRFLFYWYAQHFEKLELKRPPAGLFISRTGKHVIVVLKEKERCLLSPISLETKAILPGEFPSDCRSGAAISDDGKFIYYVDAGVPRFRALLPDSRPAAGPSVRSPKYTKVSNHFYFQDLSNDRLLVFHGSAGFYAAYLYVRGGKTLPLALDITKPFIYGTTPVFAIDRIETKTTPEPPGKAPKSAPHIVGHLFSGGTARHKIHQVELQGNALKVSAGIPAEYSRSLTYLPQKQVFLKICRDTLCYLGSDMKIRNLPMLVRRFEVFTEGIVFEDSENRLFFRRSSFTDLEQKLLQLLERASPAP